MMFTPKGLSVRVRHLRIFSRKVSALMPPAPMRPMAPALETAAANSPVAMLAMPPWMMGNSVPRISFNFMVLPVLTLLMADDTGPPCYHSSRAPPQVRLAPKPTHRTFWPFSSSPCSPISSRAMGMLAAEVLP